MGVSMTSPIKSLEANIVEWKQSAGLIPRAMEGLETSEASHLARTGNKRRSFHLS